MESDVTNNLSFDLPKNKSNVIKVIGVGGGGSNAINHMFEQGIKGVDFVISNTDAQALNESPVPIKIQLGASLTEGLGAGANPEVGALAAQESFQELSSLLNSQTKMVFITAGLGGGTGTGAAPIIAQLAKEMDILTVGIVTMPFHFEGKLRIDQAEKGLKNIKKSVDSLIVINNNKLREVYGNLGFKAGFSKADEVLATAARGIAEVITHHYHQNIDLKDARTVLSSSGTAIMGSGTATGANRSQDAVTNALDSPLLNDNKIAGCKNVLLSIVSGTEEITIDEIGEINDYIQSEAGNNVNIIMGIGDDQKLGSSIAVTIIATGFGSEQQHQIVNTEAKKIIHTLEEDQTIEQHLMGEESKTDDLSFKSVLDNHSINELVPNSASSIPISEPVEHEEINLIPNIDSLESADVDSTPIKNEVEASLFEFELADIPEITSDKLEFSIEDKAEEPIVILKEFSPEIDEAQEKISNQKLIITTEVIRNLEVVYELINPVQLPVLKIVKEKNEVFEEEFIINDLSQETNDLEVFGIEKIEAEKENQFTFDFSHPLAVKQNSISEEKVLHELDNDGEVTKAEKEVSEMDDFKFEVVEPPKSPKLAFEKLVTESSPFDQSISQTVASENEKRKAHLKKFNHTFKHSMSKVEEFEKQPAYKRVGIDLEDTSTEENTSSRMSLDKDTNDENQLRSNNSFLHDNVD
jgi:cell division protein FtsZ